MSEFVITAEHLSKCYRIGSQFFGSRNFRETVTDAVAGPFRGRARKGGQRQTDIWALDDVSFSVRSGEVLGIIGRNGSGKSTLLKVLSRITPPTRGHARIRGRVGSLREVGTGFHQELTGRENIYLSGAVLGMRRFEVESKFEEIVEFSGIKEFIDTPIKRYSSGMQVRLGFSVAAHLEPEILLTDEVLAVGDAEFQRKCLGKMRDNARSGRTILFVSHNMAAVENLCTRTILLDRGRVVADGGTRAVIETYLRSVEAIGMTPVSARTDRRGNGRLRFTGISFASGGQPAEAVQAGQELQILLAYETADKQPLEDGRPAVTVVIYSLLGACITTLGNEVVGASFASLPAKGTMSCTIQHLPLTPGQYYLNVRCDLGPDTSDWVDQAAFLTVLPGDFFGSGKLPSADNEEDTGGVLVPNAWSIVTK